MQRPRQAPWRPRPPGPACRVVMEGRACELVTRSLTFVGHKGRPEDRVRERAAMPSPLPLLKKTSGLCFFTSCHAVLPHVGPAPAPPAPAPATPYPAAPRLRGFTPRAHSPARLGVPWMWGGGVAEQGVWAGVAERGGGEDSQRRNGGRPPQAVQLSGGGHVGDGGGVHSGRMAYGAREGGQTLAPSLAHSCFFPCQGERGAALRPRPTVPVHPSPAARHPPSQTGQAVTCPMWPVARVGVGGQRSHGGRDGRLVLAICMRALRRASARGS